MTKTTSKKLTAFSLMEMIVTMAILAIVITMLSNILINTVLISQRSIARSFIREEIADVIDRISLDIKKANTISTCEGDGEAVLCEIVTDERIFWRLCDFEDNNVTQICKTDEDGNILYASSPTLKIDQFTIEQGYESIGSNRQRNILVTLVGSHINPQYLVRNVVNQSVISSRNYFLIN